MKKRYLSVMAAAAALTLSACGNPVTTDDPVDEPIPGEEQPLPGDDGIDDPLDDMDDDDLDDGEMNDEMDEPTDTPSPEDDVDG